MDTANETQDAPEPLAEDKERTVMYVNITVIDPSGAVEEKILEKANDKFEKLPKGLQKSKAASAVAKNLSKKVAKTVSTKVVKADMVAKKMADKLPEEMPAKMKEKGLTVVAEQVFLEGPFFVLQLQVQRVDTVTVAKVQAESSGIHEWLEWVLSLFGNKLTDKLETESLPKVVQAKMSQILGEKMQEKMEEKKMEVDCKTFPEEQQARYFFAHLKEIRAAKK